jgi:sarcosine oxidase subunit gamma
VTAKPLPRAHPLRSRSARFATLPDGVGLAVEPLLAQACLRVAPDGHAARVASWLGVAALPGPSSWAGGTSATVIWLGPDEWLVTTPFREPAKLEPELRAAVGADGAVVDVSAQRIALRLSGRHARDLLETGCAIDLHPRAFRAGSAVQSTIGLAGVVLLALDDAAADYQILVRASFAGYLADWLVDAAAEFRTDTESGGKSPWPSHRAS